MRRHPLTYLLLVLLVGVFAGEVAAVGFDPSASDLYRIGGGHGDAVANGEWWRLFTATWLHAGVVHLAFNAWALYVVGRGVEQIYGRATFLALWFLSALGASLLSAAWGPSVVSVGASGAIFGLFGAQLALYVRLRDRMPPEVAAAMRKGVLSTLALNVVLGLTIPGIDLAGHLGGLVTGTLFSALVLWGAPTPGSRTRSPIRAVALTTGALALAGVALVGWLRASPTHRGNDAVVAAWDARERGDLAAARDASEAAIAWIPDDVRAWVMACQVADEQRDEPMVEEWCGRALALAPDEPYALATRGRSRGRAGDARGADDLKRALAHADEAPELLGALLWSLALVDRVAAEAACNELPARDSSALLVLAICAEASSDPGVRNQRWEKVAASEASGVEALDLRGRANQHLGRAAAAVVDLTAAVALAPGDLARVNNLAWTELATGDLALARQHADAAVALDDPNHWGTRCLVRVAQRDPAGIEDCRKALVLRPDSPIDLATIAWVEGRRDEAELGWAKVDDVLWPQVLARIR